MRVLVIGASGFIGSAVVTELRRRGVATRCVVRDCARFRRQFPDVDTRALDLATSAARDGRAWAPLLEGMDAVVNAAGVLQPPQAATEWAVHRDAPHALYAACEHAGVRRIVHVSAVGVGEADTTYAQSKREGERSLMARDLDWTILRPALVVGDDAYGGASLLRAIAAFPFVTPVIGDGTIPVDVIHKEDLAKGIARLLETGHGARRTIEPASPERLSFAELVCEYRRWLGLAPRPTVGVPLALAWLIARAGDAMQMHPVTSTALAQLRTRLTGNAEEYEAVTGLRPRGLREILAARPGASQDLWHARLFLLRPLVRMSLAFLWAGSGLVGLTTDSRVYGAVLKPLAGAWGHELAVAASVVDLGVAAALVLGWRPKLMAWVQAALIVGYTATLGMVDPTMWGDPFGAVIKNVPLLVLVLVYRVLEEER